MKESLKIQSRIQDYDVFFEDDYSFLDELSKIQNSVCVIDRKVFELYKSELVPRFPKEKVFLFDAVEENKSLEGAMGIYSFITAQSAKKNLKIIAIGGGITQDITGFVASTVFRGIEWYFVPTTLLAQTDSCIGGKTSINFKSFKNLIGTFWPPRKIFINTAFLKTLTRLDFYSGLGEVLKLQLMTEGEKNLAQINTKIEKAKKDYGLLLNVIREGLQTKISYMENDEFDQGKRNLLNYGHCLGHALETSSNYELPHGIAVNVGMIFANLLAAQRGVMSSELTRHLNDDILKPNIFANLRKDYFSPQALLASLKNDKKKTGKDLAVVIADQQLNFVKLDDVKEGEFNKALDSLLSTLFMENR